MTKTGAGTLITAGGTTGANPAIGLGYVINQGAIQLNNANGLGGNNNASVPQGAITINGGTELRINVGGARNSASVTLNNGGSIRRLLSAATSDFEFLDYTTDTLSNPVIFGSTFTVNG